MRVYRNIRMHLARTLITPHIARTHTRHSIPYCSPRTLIFVLAASWCAFSSAATTSSSALFFKATCSGKRPFYTKADTSQYQNTTRNFFFSLSRAHPSAHSHICTAQGVVCAGARFLCAYLISLACCIRVLCKQLCHLRHSHLALGQLLKCLMQKRVS